MINRKSILIIITILFLIPVKIIFSQTDSSYIEAEDVLDDILQEPSEETDNSDLYESIEYLLNHPINLNTAKISDLQQIPELDLESARLIISYKEKYGYFFSVKELNAVQGLDKDLIERISPFLKVIKNEKQKAQTIKNESTFDEILYNTNFKLRSRLINDLQTRKGFINNKYEGTKPKVYNRMTLKYSDNYQAGFLAEKDAGESSIDEFKSYYFAINEIGHLQNLIVGDYLVEFGQGLSLWSPYGFSKGSDAVYPVKKRERKLRPYASATETGFLHGAASSIIVDDFTFSAFFSKNKMEANIDPVTGDILSVQVDGLHRTETEIKKKNAAEETLWGGRIDYTTGELIRTGLMHYRSKYSNSFSPSDVFDLKGNEFNFTSFYYDLIINNINIFGEFVYNGTSVASINSVQFSIIRDLSFISSIRSYPRNYVSLHGYAFAERSGAPSNEFGIYNGIKWRTPIGLLNFYYDQFKFPFATFLNPLPSEGDEFLADLTSKPLSKVETRIRYKYEDKDITESIDNTKQLVKRLRQTIRFELIYYPTKNLRLKGRYEFNNYRIASIDVNEDGYLFFQDIRYSPSANFNLYARIIFFRTDSFNSAIYEYENDLTGILSNLAMYGEGIRWYLIVRYRPMKLFTISAKYSETYKPKEKSLSSGNNTIDGNLDNRLSLQLDLSI